MMHQKPHVRNLDDMIKGKLTTSTPMRAQLLNNSSACFSSIGSVSSTHADAHYVKMIAASYHHQTQGVNDSERAVLDISRAIYSSRSSFSRPASLRNSSRQDTAVLPLSFTATTNPIDIGLNARIQGNRILSTDVLRNFDILCSDPTSEEDTMLRNASLPLANRHRHSGANYAAALLYESHIELLLSARNHRSAVARLSRLTALQQYHTMTSALNPTFPTDGIGRLSNPFDYTELGTSDAVLFHPKRNEKIHVAPSLASTSSTITSIDSEAKISSSAVGAPNATILSTNVLSSTMPIHSKQQHRVFPAILHRALRAIGDTEQGAAIAAFLPGGTAFAIRNQFLFEQKVLPVFFPRMKNFASFQRQLNLYDFKRLGNWGIDQEVVYCHDMFVRENPLLAGIMKRTKIKGVHRRGNVATK